MINNEVAIKALELCKNSRTVIPTNEILEYIIAVLKKQIPKKPIIKPWSEARCPTCGTVLSEDLGDGYYKHYIHWEYCHNPECLQRLDWGMIWRD